MEMKTIGTIAYMIVMVFYGVYTMVLSIQAYTKFSDTSERYLNIAANYKESPIIDVVDKKDKTCDSGYSSLFNWDWKGMSVGCDCSGTARNNIYPGACTANYTKIGCVSTKAIPAYQFSYFEGAATKKMNVCVKRLDSSQAFYKVASKQSGTCSSTQKLCGNKDIKETVYCVEKNDLCPVYDIAMSINNDPQYDPSIYTVKLLDNGKSLYIDQKGTKAKKGPLSELRLTQGQGVCELTNNAKRLPSGQSDYVLSLTNRTSCSGVDSSFVWNNFEIPENKYYSINLNADDLTKLKALPGIKIPSSVEPFRTYQRQYITWKVDKRDKMKDFVDSADSISNLKSAQLTTMVINIFVCIMVSIILQISQVYNLMGKDVPCIDGKGDEEKVRIVRIKKILTYGAKLLQAPFLLWAFIVSAQKKGMLRDVADTAPMDGDYNSQIDKFATQIENDVFKKNLAALIVLLLTVLLDLAIFLKGKYCPSKKGTTVEPAKMDDENNLKNQNNNASMFQNQYDPKFTPENNNQTYQMQPIQPGQQQYNGLPVQQQPMQPMQPGVVYQTQPGVVPIQQGVIYQQPVVYQQQPVYVQPVQPVVVVQNMQPMQPMNPMY